MKLWYDDKKIPAWVERVALIATALVLGTMLGFGLLGISFKQFLALFI
jgi:hypothetical protein